MEGNALTSMLAGAIFGRVRATMPLNEPLRRLPSNVTTCNFSDMMTPVVVYQFGEKAFTVESWAKRIIRLVGLLARL
ncbi:hypothetical protein ESCOCP365M1_03680 [Escherichia coli]